MELLKRPRYSVPVLKRNQPDDTYKFRVPPPPSGTYPFHLNLQQASENISEDKYDIHLVGDTGGIYGHDARHLIAAEMTARYQPGSFLYHLGDLVYHHGEASAYEEQFFAPFQQYPGPVFAIAGNHDSDVNVNAPVPYDSLDGFAAVFCQSNPGDIAFAGSSKWKSSCQPNIYWTLETPLATIIGLHSNVPKYGIITANQQEWLRQELIAAPADKLLFVCVHHAPYSADINHGSSLPVSSALESAFAATGVFPDMVMSGHVHNYQRFTKTWPNGHTTPFIVAGAGGFDELHNIATLDDERFYDAGFSEVSLIEYCEDKHGFLELALFRGDSDIRLTGTYSTVSEEGAQIRDKFKIVKALSTISL